MENGDNLKELVLNYQKTQDPRVFLEILIIVDEFLLYLSHRYSKSLPYLQNVDLEDIYHTIIVSVHWALLSVKEYESRDKITARIMTYAKAELRFEYEKINKIKTFSEISDKSIEEIVDDFDVEKNLISEELLTELYKLVDKGILRANDLWIIILKDCCGLTFQEIIKRFDLKRSTVELNYKKAMKIIRENLNKEDFI